MKRLLASLLLIIPAAFSASADNDVPQVANVLNRHTTSLNGKWNYIVDVQEEGFYDYRMKPNRWGFFLNAKPQKPEDLIEYDFDKSPSMNIPGDWNTQDDKLFFYEGTVWFKRSFSWHPSSDRRTILYFGAANYDTHVYVNGTHVGHHIGGFTPFNYDVTDLLKDGDNVVIVKVDNKRRVENIPTLIFDWWNYGGITRDVLLVDVPTTYIENYKLALLSQSEKKGKVRLIDFSLNLNKAVAGQQVTLSIPELKVKQSLQTDKDGKVSTTLRVSKLQLWSPDSPKLYDVNLVCGNDTLHDAIGFRTVETRGKQILLNGEPIFLRGISIHEEKSNGGGRANCTEDAHHLLSWAKELGCNFVRLAHYPHNEYAVREAERMGFLVWSELPVYWTIDWTNDATFNNALHQLNDMVARDQNRANIIIWSIANETPHSPERDSFLSRLAKSARALDNTRLISMAMEVTSADHYHNRLQDNMNEYVDVISFNEYIGWYRDVNDAPKMTWEVPYNKPVIISEFGGGAKAGYHGAENQRWTEEFQERLYKENIAMLDKIDGLSGTTPWILKDFRSPRRVLFGVQDYYNRKGLFSDNGDKKKAFYILRQWYDSKKSASQNNNKKK
ncbi:MAG: beta-glucuronidase [Bacteroidales bacterium]|nr:beta-glucuronidase [Bacteroidales bacterium]